MGKWDEMACARVAACRLPNDEGDHGHQRGRPVFRKRVVGKEEPPLLSVF